MTTKGNIERIRTWQRQNAARLREHRATFKKRHPDYWTKRRQDPDYQEAQKQRVKAWRERKARAKESAVIESEDIFS